MSENLRLMLAGKMTYNPSELHGWEIELYEDITEYREKIEDLEEICANQEAEITSNEELIEEQRDYIDGLERERIEEVKGLREEIEEKENLIEELEGRLEACGETYDRLAVKYNNLLDSVSFDAE